MTNYHGLCNKYIGRAVEIRTRDGEFTGGLFIVLLQTGFICNR